MTEWNFKLKSNAPCSNIFGGKYFIQWMWSTSVDLGDCMFSFCKRIKRPDNKISREYTQSEFSNMYSKDTVISVVVLVVVPAAEVVIVRKNFEQGRWTYKRCFFFCWWCSCCDLDRCWCTTTNYSSQKAAERTYPTPIAAATTADPQGMRPPVLQLI